MTATKDNFFNPAKLAAGTKAADTNATARGMVDAEAAARDKKTQSLKALRLAQQSLSRTSRDRS
ncbi:hypothetical protein FZ934_13535 [Rhizobium grahamii]|uniref:Uncharacterized protein n=1 Tax=Rhizobium grahamii TaxID=1120045 RepID=A0A5Q0CBS7_9HYPH|nr:MULTISPECIES: hypothetical protein [Rhizobium]QFY61331.1 hypothetical protein FZ934_13535 [Rhizobium grahamii]QRM49520.1 hypothetical protein F3Y33_09355 [Rhizobium sp. BG6]